MTDIANFLNNVASKDFAKAEKQFADMMNTKIHDRLQDVKTSIAQQVFNSTEEQDLADEDI